MFELTKKYLHVILISERKDKREKQMRNKILYTLYALAFVVIAIILGKELFLSEERDYYTILRSVVTIAVSFRLLTKGNNPWRVNRKQYEKQYEKILPGAFQNDKKSYQKLLKAINLYNHDSYIEAERILDKLLAKCVTAKDYTSVLMFKALSLTDRGASDEAVETYKKLLNYDYGNSMAWSNLGSLYRGEGNSMEGITAVKNAILYDPSNAFAYNNLAAQYISTGDFELALKNALYAIELDSSQPVFMSNAAVAYKCLGDDKNAEKYCKLHATKGGDTKALREVLDSIGII